MTLPRYILLDKNTDYAFKSDLLSEIVKQINEDSLSVWEIEDFKCHDATEQACRAWCNSAASDKAELDAFGQLDVPTIIKNHCGDWVAEQEERALEHIASLQYERRQYQSAVL